MDMNVAFRQGGRAVIVVTLLGSFAMSLAGGETAAELSFPAAHGVTMLQVEVGRQPAMDVAAVGKLHVEDPEQRPKQKCKHSPDCSMTQANGHDFLDLTSSGSSPGSQQCNSML